MPLAGLGVFALVFLLIPVLALASVGVGIAALISIACTPVEAFGPWWDNTRQVWLGGISVSFLIPFGNLVTGILWFSRGRGPLRSGQGYAGRPFWSGPPRPPPGWGPPPPGYGPPPPPPPPPAG